MKNIFKVLISLTVLFALAACEKDEEKVIIDPKAPTLLTPANGTTMVLKKEDRDKSMEFTWSAATFGFDASVTYTLEVAKQGTNFASPLVIGVVNNKTKLTIIVDDFNNKMLNLLTDPEIAETLALNMRVVATVSQYVDPLRSGVFNISVTPYISPIVYPLLSVPGQHNGWNPGDSTHSIGSRKSDGKYEGYLWFPTANNEFKYTESFSWAVNWGDNGADGTLERDGANIVAGGAGYYKLNVNLNNKTHTFLRTEWGLIGSATPGGWSSDQNMTYNIATKVWTITLDLVAGDIKFRANDDWAVNLGDDGADGKLDYNGANIAITTAGNYTITLDLSKTVYRYNIKKN